MIIKDDAIVLKAINYSNSSQILTLYTKKNGKISGLAKGVRNSKSLKQFYGSFEPIMHVQVVYREKDSQVLSTIREFDIKDYFYGVRKNLISTLNAFYLVDFVNECTSPYDPSLGLFQLLHTSLKYLSMSGNTEKIRFFFQVKALILLGFMPQLEECFSCGEKPQDLMQFFHLEESYIVCDKCKHFYHGLLIPISLQSAKNIQSLSVIPWEGLKKLYLSPKIIEEMNNFFRVYFRNIVSKDFRTFKYIAGKI